MTPSLIPDPLSLLRAALAGGKVVAWLTTSPLSSEIRIPLCSRKPRDRVRRGCRDGRSNRSGRMDKGLERGEGMVIKWEEIERDKER